jgi:PGF-pre-PGF domain-containing protein
MSYSTTYYWMIITVDANGIGTPTSIWSFTTQSQPSGGDDGDGGGGGGGGSDTGDSAPIISGVSHEPGTVTSVDTVTIYATITDDNSVDSANIYWNDGTDHSQAMTLQEGTTYSATIGPFTIGITVTYSFDATDNAGQTRQSIVYSFTVEAAVESVEEEELPDEPTITIINPTAESTITDRTPTIQASYSDPDGIDSSSVTISLDGTDKTSYATVTDTQVSYTPTIPLSWGAHTVIVTVADTLGNTGSREWTFTVKTIITAVNVTVENISAGEERSIDYDSDTATTVETIIIKAGDSEISSVNVLVSRREEGDEPEEEPISEPTKKVEIYAYVDIELTGGENVESLSITFKVEKTWLETNGIDKETVQLLRFHEGEWKELPTTFVDEDDTYVYFEAVTPGTSTFAIIGSTPITAQPDAFAAVLEAIEPLATYIVLIAAVIAAIIIIVVFLFKTGYLHIEDIKGKKGKH